MNYFIIHREDRNGPVIGMSMMPMPPGGMTQPCSLRVVVDNKTRTFRVEKNKNKGLPLEWVPLYYGREITTTEFETFVALDLFRVLKNCWFDRFKRRFLKK